jgi:hypothetical protein
MAGKKKKSKGGGKKGKGAKGHKKWLSLEEKKVIEAANAHFFATEDSVGFDEGQLKRIKEAIDAYVRIWHQCNRLDYDLKTLRGKIEAAQQSAGVFDMWAVGEGVSAEAVTFTGGSAKIALAQQQDSKDISRLLLGHAEEQQTQEKRLKSEIGVLKKRVLDIIATLGFLTDKQQVNLVELLEIACAEPQLQQISAEIDKVHKAAMGVMSSLGIMRERKKMSRAKMIAQAGKVMDSKPVLVAHWRSFFTERLVTAYECYYTLLMASLQEHLLAAAETVVMSEGVRQVGLRFPLIDSPIMHAFLQPPAARWQDNYFMVVTYADGSKCCVHFYDYQGSNKYAARQFDSSSEAAQPASEPVSFLVFVLTGIKAEATFYQMKGYDCCRISGHLVRLFQENKSAPFFLAPYPSSLLFAAGDTVYVELRKFIIKGKGQYRFLEYSPSFRGGFQREERHPLNCHFIQAVRYLDEHGFDEFTLAIRSDGSFNKLAAIMVTELGGGVEIEPLPMRAGAASEGGRAHRRLSVVNTGAADGYAGGGAEPVADGARTRAGSVLGP